MQDCAISDAVQEKGSAHAVVHQLLDMVAENFNRPGPLRKYLSGDQGWLNFTIGIRTENGSVESAIGFKDGVVEVSRAIPSEGVDVVMIMASESALIKFFTTATTTEQVYMLLTNEMRSEGKQTYLLIFTFFLSVLFHPQQIKGLDEERELSRKSALDECPLPSPGLSRELAERRAYRMKAESIDPGVRFLPEPYLSQYSLDDFPRLKKFLDFHFETKPQICIELPKLLTDWHKKNGFDTKPDGTPWIPELRRGHAFRYIMENRQPIIRKGDLVAGTNSSKPIGVLPHVDANGLYIWPELFTVPYRLLEPCDITEEDAWTLHHEIFPYWLDKNFKEILRSRHNNPLALQIDERFSVYFDFKSAAFSHTIPDFPRVLRLGTSGIIEEIRSAMKGDPEDPGRTAAREAMILCLEGVTTYSRNLSKQATAEAAAETDPKRKKELENLAAICAHVVEYPARSLDEAVNAISIIQAGIHMENTDAALSLGRLDQWLQPYFEADMAKLATQADRDKYIRHAIELVGCLFFRCMDLECMKPNYATVYFGGSPEEQSITIGGVTRDGEDAVNDMTYIFLKVAEMLSITDPNMNARYNHEKNSDTYLKRLCEVNIINVGMPAIHNDVAMMKSLSQFNYDEHDLRDWGTVGCVEPDIVGKHTGHTNFQLMSLVGALEMALNNGTHPRMRWKLGPETGSVENGDFTCFEQFYEAFLTQFKFLIDQSIQLNNWYGEVHQYVRPTPFLSALIDGCIAKGLDTTKGGAKYNSSGAALIGLADLIDSLLVIKKLVFEEKKVSFADLKRAVDTDFRNDPVLHAMVTKEVPFFGSGSAEAVSLANRFTKFTHDYYAAMPHYRGGEYRVGYWSMAQHVAFGTLTGALPSGRRSGKPFTPGLTPEPNASRNLLDNMCDVARLDPYNITNNIAFNVKIAPSAHDTREKTVQDMCSYIKSYFALGGMQIQMNVVTSETLRDAMAYPESYRNLVVRISGYSAYFTELPRDLQHEVISRAEYGL